MLQCTFCGSEIPPDARFCGSCGRMPGSPPDGQTRISGLHRVGLEPVPPDMVMPASQPGVAASAHRMYDLARNKDDASTIAVESKEEDPHRRDAIGLLPGIGAADALAGGGTVPMVQGTPQIGGVPSVANLPPIQGGLAGGNMPGGGRSWNSAATEVVPNIPAAYPHTPPVPGRNSPTQTLHPPHYPQQPKPPHGNPTPKGCAPTLLIVAILIPLIMIGSIVTLAFTAFAPTLALSGSSNVTSGGTLALHGSHFLPGSSITLTLDNSLPVYVEARQPDMQTARVLNGAHTLSMAADQVLAQTASNSINAAGDGTFSVNITVDPNWSAGQHTMQASESITHRSARLTFTILGGNATPTPSPTATNTPSVTPSPSPTVSPSVSPTVTVTTSPPATQPELSCVNPSSVTLGPVSVNYAQAVSTSVSLCTQGTGSVNWTASWNQGQAPWLVLNQTTGSITAPGQAQINVSANASQLAAGNYTAAVAFSSQPGNVTETLNVTFIVQVGCIKVAPNTLNFAATPNIKEAAPQTVALTNCGAVGTWSANAKTSDGANWLSVSPNGGTLGTSAPGNATITASSLNSTLAVGNYTGTVTFTIGSGTFIVNVNFTVEPVLAVTPTSLVGIKQCGNGNSGYYNCYLSLTNTSHTLSLAWTASTNLLPNSIIKPASGTMQPGQTTRVQIAIPVSDCSTGASITFSGPGNSVTVSWTC